MRHAGDRTEKVAARCVIKDEGFLRSSRYLEAVIQGSRSYSQSYSRGSSTIMTAEIAEFVKHVSFDDLAPTMIDDHAQALKNSNRHIGFNNQFLHIPPQFNPFYHTEEYDFGDWSFSSRNGNPKTSRRSSDQNQSHNDKVEKMFAFTARPPNGKKSSRSSVHENAYRSRSGSPLRSLQGPRLPPPPGVSSLKVAKKSVDEQGPITDYNVADMDLETERKMNKETLKNTQANSGSSSGFTQSAFSNLNELEDRLDSKNKNTAKLSKDQKGDSRKGGDNKKKKKSFADMTDQELAALEDYYASQSRSSASTPTIEKFDFREQNPFFIDNITKKNTSGTVDPLAAIYPSRPVVNHRAISVTIQHDKYEEFVENVNIKTGSKKPEESLVALRIVSCYISGKRYTWSSADWYVENMVEDGDHLVIVTSIPPFEKEVEDSDNALTWKRRAQSQRLDRMLSAERIISPVDTETDNDTTNSLDHLSKGVRIQAIHEEARIKCNKILNYYASRIGNKIVKITVEMIKEEKLIDSITKAAALYKPDIQIFSTVSTNLQIKFRNGSVKLPFFVMRHYAMPTIVIPFEFIDPKILGEDVIIQSENSGEENAESNPTSKAERIQIINSIVEKTLANPFLNDGKKENDNEKTTDTDDESVVRSLDEYFPISPERKRNIELFERLGYIRAPPTRLSYLPKTCESTDLESNGLHPVSTAGSSKRSSRIQYDDGIYKVKSLIDDLSDEEETAIDKKISPAPTYYNSSKMRKTKSMVPMSKSTTRSSTVSPPLPGTTPKHPGLSKFKSQNDSIFSSTGSKNTNKPTKPKKKGFASLFKKVFK